MKLINKNQIHMSMLLILLSLFIVGAISSTFAYIGYQSLLRNINNDTTTKFKNDYRVAKVTIQEKFIDEIRAFLDTTSLYIKDIIKQEGRFNVQTLKEKDIFDPDIDISFAYIYDDDEYIEFGLNLFAPKPLLEAALKHDTSRHMQLLQVPIFNETKTILLESEKLINPENGHVIGTLYAGIILDNNFKIVEEIKKITGSEAVFITCDEHILAASESKHITQLVANDFIHIPTDEILRKKNHVFFKKKLALNGEIHDKSLYLILIEHSNIFEELKKDMLSGIVILFVVSLVLFIILETILLKFIIRFFSEVHKLALSNIKEGGAYAFEPTVIKELNDIGFSIQSLITSLQESNATLQKRVEQEVEKVKEQQEVIYEQSRQSALSELLVNIAHQWRQPLNVISLRAINVSEYIEFKPEEYEKKIIEQTEQITKDTEALSTLITEFTSFYESKDKEHFELYDAIEQAIRLSDLKGFKIFNNTAKDILVYAGRKAFIETINIILQNAKDIAFERNVKKPELTIKTEISDEKIKITLEDNLGGFDTAILPKVFDPYTTTKFKSRNKGLGLFLANNLVKYRLSGTIMAENIKDGARIAIEVNNNDRKKSA